MLYDTLDAEINHVFFSVLNLTLFGRMSSVRLYGGFVQKYLLNKERNLRGWDKPTSKKRPILFSLVLKEKLKLRKTTISSHTQRNSWLWINRGSACVWTPNFILIHGKNGPCLAPISRSTMRNRNLYSAGTIPLAAFDIQSYHWVLPSHGKFSFLLSLDSWALSLYLTGTRMHCYWQFRKPVGWGKGGERGGGGGLYLFSQIMPNVDYLHLPQATATPVWPWYCKRYPASGTLHLPSLSPPISPALPSPTYLHLSSPLGTSSSPFG